MADFVVNKRQSLIDICLEVYGTTQQLFTLAKDNSLNIDSDVSPGDVLTFDVSLGNLEIVEKIEAQGLKMVNDGD